MSALVAAHNVIHDVFSDGHSGTENIRGNSRVENVFAAVCAAFQVRGTVGYNLTMWLESLPDRQW